MDMYKDPKYERELFPEVLQRVLHGDQIVSIVGMRQVGKSTILRQVIRTLLGQGVNPKHIFYVSFDDPLLRANFDSRTLFQQAMDVYTDSVLQSDLREVKHDVYFFFDEVHLLPDWERVLKTYYDRRYPAHYVVSGSSSLHLQKKNRESLLGRISEHTLWPFSFREYVGWAATERSKDEDMRQQMQELYKLRLQFLEDMSLKNLFLTSEVIFKALAVWKKQEIHNFLRTFVVEGGFPRVWQQPDLASKQRTLWEQHVGKTLFEDLLHVAHIRRVRDLEFLFIRLLGFNGGETTQGELKKDVNMSHVTLERYISLFIKTCLLFRVERTKSARLALKRRSGKMKFYVSDPALWNALYKKDERIFDAPQEMSFIAETLVCSTLERWTSLLPAADRVGYYSERGEVDFMFKYGTTVLPIEVKWRNDITALKTLDNVVKKWQLKESMVVTKDFDMTYRDGRLSIPLWFFLLVF